MGEWYIELTNSTDLVNIDGETGTAAEYAASHPDSAAIVNDSPTTYPDVIFNFQPTTAKVNGTVVEVHEIIGGNFPTTVPVPRPR